MTRYYRCGKFSYLIETINIYDAKENQLKLIREVARTGEPIVIAQNGHALVKVVTYKEQKPKRKLSFLKGKASLLNDFDDLNAAEIQDMFKG